MSARPSSLRLLLALLAWAAQLCLPVAHAASMASSGAGALAWCGTGSAAMQAQLRELPADVREALQASGAQGDHVKSCAQLCAAIGAPGLPEPASVTVQLRAAGLEPAPADRTPAPLHAHAYRPPPRGPPSNS